MSDRTTLQVAFQSSHRLIEQFPEECVKSVTFNFVLAYLLDISCTVSALHDTGLDSLYQPLKITTNDRAYRNSACLRNAIASNKCKKK